MEEKQNLLLGELLIRLGKGDISVLDQIYVIMSRLLYTVGNIYYRQIADIEDAIQDLMITLYYKAKKFKSNKNACSWILTVYQNSIKNKLVKNKKEDEYIEKNKLNINIQFNSIVDEKYIENHIFINNMFSTLSENERQLLINYYWVGLSINEIAKNFKKPKSTIQSQIEKLKDKMKK